jgi:hypothetical protein
VLTATSGSCIARFRTLPRARPDPKEEGDAGDDVSQPALQYLAQDLGAAARKRRRADDHRIPEDALYNGAAEDAAGKLVRKKEAAAAGIDPAALSEDALVEAMAKNPIIVERPIVVSGRKAALGRPPEAVLSVL